MDVTTPTRPKGALTQTARQSKRASARDAVAAALSFALLIGAGHRDWRFWVLLALTLYWAILAVLNLRSWRILKRLERA
jgi:hypothetical protein